MSYINLHANILDRKHHGYAVRELKNRSISIFCRVTGYVLHATIISGWGQRVAPLRRMRSVVKCAPFAGGCGQCRMTS